MELNLISRCFKRQHKENVSHAFESKVRAFVYTYLLVNMMIPGSLVKNQEKSDIRIQVLSFPKMSTKNLGIFLDWVWDVGPENLLYFTFSSIRQPWHRPKSEEEARRRDAFSWRRQRRRWNASRRRVYLCGKWKGRGRVSYSLLTPSPELSRPRFSRFHPVRHSPIDWKIASSQPFLDRSNAHLKSRPTLHPSSDAL